LAFSHDDGLLAAGGAGQNGGVVALWDLSSSEPIVTTFRGHRSNVPDIAFSPDGHLLASASWDTSIRIWNVSSGEWQELPGHENWINDVDFSMDGQWLASAGSDNTVRLWNLKTGSELRDPITFSSGVSVVRFVRDDTLIAASAGDQISFWTLTEDATAPPPVPIYGPAARNIAYDANEDLLAVESIDGTIVLWDLDQAKFPLVDTRHAQMGAASVAISSDGSMLAAGGYGDILIWDMHDGGPPQRFLAAHKDGLKHLSFSANGCELVSVSIDGTARVWDAKSMSPVGERIRVSRAGAIRDVAVDSSGTLMAMSRFDGPFEVWEIATRKPLPGDWKHLEESVDSAAFNSLSDIVATGGEDGTVTLWNIATGKALGEPMLAQKTGVTTMAFTPDDDILVTGSTDGTVLFWDVAHRELTGEKENPGSGTVLTLAFNEDGTMLAVGGYQNPIVLWDVAARRVLGEPLEFRDDMVEDIAFSSKKRLLASTNSLGDSVQIWDLNLTSWQTAARERANRTMSANECGRFVGDLEYSDSCRMSN
jgi:WD40 repeat protein